MKIDLKSLTREELERLFVEWNEKSYRLDQLLHWVYRKRATSWAEMTNLPASLRERLNEQLSLQSLELVRRQGSDDSTRKYLWRLSDQALVETVLIPANPALYGETSDRHTLCISTQVGCAYGCRFCASGLDGWKRNLLPHEIVDQVLAVERDEISRSAEKRTDERIVNNIVVMGMGEPLANFPNLLKALTILNAPWGGGIGARKITISTSGLAPKIRELAQTIWQFRLAISLHGATDEVRNKIMPVNRRYPLKELVEACQFYQAQKGQMLTLEYILIAGINDGMDQVEPLAALAHKLKAKINLIPYNHVDGLEWQRPSESVQEQFLAGLEKRKVPVTLRREKGHDIDAACGQLRLRTDAEFRQSPLTSS